MKKYGPTPGRKLQNYPTNLTRSTPVMGCKGLGEMAGDGFVECDGLDGDFSGRQLTV
jgi:hypothetical protein